MVFRLWTFMLETLCIYNKDHYCKVFSTQYMVKPFFTEMNTCTTLKEAETTSTEVEQTVLTPRADRGVYSGKSDCLVLPKI